jgi:Fe-S cluster assembly protein SufD
MMVDWQNNNLSEMTADCPGNTVEWLRELREQQWQHFLNRGFPTRRDESWKYTDLSSLTPQAIIKSSAPPEVDKSILDQLENKDAIQLVFVDGQLCTELSDCPKGLVISDLSTALNVHPEWVKRGFSEYQDCKSGMMNFNTSLWRNGFFIRVEEDTVIDQPIVIRTLTKSTEPSFLVFRSMIYLGKNSRLTLIQDFEAQSESPYWQHTLSQFHLDDNAELELYKIQNEGAEAIHLSENWIQQADHALVNAYQFSLGAKLHRESWQLKLSGQGAVARCRGLTMANQTQHFDTHLTMNHQAPACQSEQVFKSIATDKSRSIFNGKVIVEAKGQQAQAHQLSQNLLLSSLAEIDTRPELEIYADDVKCSHGATVGELDPDALFYLQSRGINREEAGAMLLHAFIQDQLREVPDWILEWIMPSLEKKLALINGGKSQ